MIGRQDQQIPTDECDLEIPRTAKYRDVYRAFASSCYVQVLQPSHR